MKTADWPDETEVHMKKHLSIALALVLGMSLTACGDEHDDHEDNNHANHTNVETPEEEACEHMEEGPFQDVTAAEDSTGTLENIAVPHTRMDVALAGEGADRGGVVSFEASEAGEYTFYLSQDVGFELADSNAMVLTPEASAGPVSLCATAILATHTFDLQVGTYTITMGPADLETLAVIFEAGEHEH